MSRKMSEFMVKTPVFMEWYNWLADMIDGDESYFSTLATLDIDKDGKIHQNISKNINIKKVSFIFDNILLPPCDSFTDCPFD